MSEKQTKRARRELRGQSLDPFPTAIRNVDVDAVDTRADRRDKRFRKKKIEQQTKAGSFVELIKERAKWNRALYPLFNARLIRETNAAKRAADREDIEV